MRRLREWLRVLEAVEETARRLESRLGGVMAVLYGSYARGDFNLWSDVDLIIVSPAFRGIRFLDRYEVIIDILEPGMQPVAWTPEELRRAVSKPSWRHALREGHAVVVDTLSLASVIAEAVSGGLVWLSDLKARVERLARGA